MKTNGLFRPLALLALFACSPLEPACGGITQNRGEEVGEPDAPTEISIVQIAGPFEFPWSIAFLPDGSTLVTERVGRLQLIQHGMAPSEIAGIPSILNDDQAGLLDVAVDPAFGENRTVYLSYVHGTTSSSAVRVLKARLDQASLRLTEHQVIFESAPGTITKLFGGRIAVTHDGYLFLTLGERWQPERAQDLSKNAGKIIRIRTDGSVPQDNPFISVPGAQPQIWTYGHRNPQGLAFDARTNKLWSHEHGPLGGDELNLILPGRNYGWPVITYGLDYSGKPIGEGAAKEGMEQPFHFWPAAIAPSGLAIESTGDITVFWITALAGRALVRLEMEHGRIVREHRLLQNKFGRIRDVRISPDGLLYMITDSSGGALYRLESIVEQASRHRSSRRRL